jgi:hypothetical protein
MNIVFLDKIITEHNQIETRLKELHQTESGSYFKAKIEVVNQLFAEHLVTESHFFSDTHVVNAKQNRYNKILIELFRGLEFSYAGMIGWTDLMDCIRLIFSQHRQREEQLIKEFLGM